MGYLPTVFVVTPLGAAHGPLPNDWSWAQDPPFRLFMTIRRRRRPARDPDLTHPGPSRRLTTGTVRPHTPVLDQRLTTFR